jgi:hypothetical protein
LLEQRFVRLPGLEKWFVRITPLFSAQHVWLFLWIGLKEIIR